MKRAKTCDGRANSKGEDWIDLCASDSDSDVVCCSKVCSAAKEGKQQRNRNDTFNSDLALARTLQQQEDQSANSVHGGTYKVSFTLSPCTYTFLERRVCYKSSTVVQNKALPFNHPWRSALLCHCAATHPHDIYEFRTKFRVGNVAGARE